MQAQKNALPFFPPFIIPGCHARADPRLNTAINVCAVGRRLSKAIELPLQQLADPYGNRCSPSLRREQDKSKHQLFYVFTKRGKVVRLSPCLSGHRMLAEFLGKKLHAWRWEEQRLSEFLCIYYVTTADTIKEATSGNEKNKNPTGQYRTMK